METEETHVFRMICRDTKGIVARVTGLLAAQGANILDLEQHVEADSGLFAMRVHCACLGNPKKFTQELSQRNPFKDFQYWLDAVDRKQRVAILVTREAACLYELLLKHKLGELACDIPLIISNHRDLQTVASEFAIPFQYLPVEGASVRKQETTIAGLLEKYEIDLVVLARYMRILSRGFVDKRAGKIINIHHSFLPAFKGAQPYRQAFERGVKMIGATAHYVTADLDDGPIIHQNGMQVSHHYTVDDLVRSGRELERTVLFQAVKAHLEYRVLLLGKRTIVFRF